MTDLTRQEAAELVAQHRSDGRKLCYAQSLGPITFRVGVYSRQQTRTAVLRCTLPLGHEGEHQDGNANGYAGRVPFPINLATDPEPEHYQWEACVKCRASWPCDVAKLAPFVVEQDAVPEVP